MVVWHISHQHLTKKGFLFIKELLWVSIAITDVINTGKKKTLTL